MVIIRAAIMYQNGEVVEGQDYGRITTLANRLSFSGDKVHGFMTSTGEFVLPTEAATIALNAKQIAGKVDQLTPDMLWPHLGED